MTPVRNQVDATLALANERQVPSFQTTNIGIRISWSLLNAYSVRSTLIADMCHDGGRMARQIRRLFWTK